MLGLEGLGPKQKLVPWQCIDDMKKPLWATMGEEGTSLL